MWAMVWLLGAFWSKIVVLRWIKLHQDQHDIITWKHFLHYWPFVRGTSHWWTPLKKASDAELWCFIDLRLNKRLSKQSKCCWFEMPSCSLWNHYNVKRLWNWRTTSSLTHWGLDKMVVIFQTTFSNAFSWLEMWKLRLRFHWSVFPRVKLKIFQHWFR